MTYAADRLWEEVAYVAYYLHWSLDEILRLDHVTRERMITEIGKINAAISGEPGSSVAGWGGEQTVIVPDFPIVELADGPPAG